MKHSVRKEPIIEVGTTEKKSSYSSTVWILCLAVLFVAGNVIAFAKMWGTLSPGIWKVSITALLTMAFMAGVEFAKKKYEHAGILKIVPLIIAFLIGGFGNCVAGMKIWINLLISRWNQIHEGGAAVFQVQMSSTSIQAFSVVVALLIGMIGYILIKGHHTVLCFFYELVWFYLLLADEIFDPLAGGLMFAAFLGLCISTKQQNMTRRGFLCLAIVVGVFCIGSGLTDQTELDSIQKFRENVQAKVHTMRYGEDVLPEGNLRQSDELKASKEDMLTVKTQQDKNLYLRGFVGSTYQDGSWVPLSDSAYGGDNSGMIKWLKKQKFDPLSQSADYQSLGNDSEEMPQNQVQVTVTGASRYYVYVPSSLLEVTDGSVKEKTDTRYVNRGIFGEREYIYEEKSGTRPSELTVTDSWVANPDTGKRKRYSKAEAAYRNFVYDHYTTVDAEIYDLVKEMFWDDYKSENDGIYSALNQVRSKLSENLSYVEQPKAAPEGEDPIIWGLKEAHEGNDMLYTSIAIEALRAHGIPARYVEGYYLSSEDVANSQNKTVRLTGQDAHAWLEVYFDGVGWQPVDVTPGYYFDALSLRNMVSMPDSEHKSAAIQDRENGAENSTKLEDTKKNNGSKIPKVVRDIAAIVKGALTVLVLLIYIWLIILEGGRLIFAWREKKDYQNSDQKGQVLFIENALFGVLSFIGINARLGWKTNEIDQLLAERFAEIKPGEYARTCELIERSVYGDVELKPHEMRTIQTFLEKIRNVLKEGSDKRARLMLRYEWIHKKWILKKLNE